ncbi:MAG: hypothetical protein J0L88_07205 [Xanthomonadales bacterium]|nr:hypothetical protein [Xanthomonadales bacterium]
MEHEIPWTTHTIARLNTRLGVTPDDDIGVEDWPEAMSDPALVDAALAAYDHPDAGDDDRALIVELLLNTFEFCSIEREGNPDWRRMLDRIERDYAEHAPTVARWAEPEDGNPWLVSAELKVLQGRMAARG